MCFYLQEGRRGRSRELQAGQPHLSSWEGDRANLPENHFQTQGSKKVIRSSQQRFMKRKSCLTNLIAFYNEMTWCRRGEQWMLFASTLVRLQLSLLWAGELDLISRCPFQLQLFCDSVLLMKTTYILVWRYPIPVCETNLSKTKDSYGLPHFPALFPSLLHLLQRIIIWT